MPLIFWIPYRIAKAFAATGRLLFDVKLMRSLPWPHLRQLPRKDPWVAILVVAISLALVALPFIIVLPVRTADVAYQIGLWPLLAAIVTTWIRLFGRAGANWIRAFWQRHTFRGS